MRDGIDRFRTGKYGGRHATGFMIGYVLSDRALDAAHGINRCLSGKGRHAELLHGSGLLDECWAWSSCHPREPPSKSPIILDTRSWSSDRIRLERASSLAALGRWGLTGTKASSRHWCACFPHRVEQATSH